MSVFHTPSMRTHSSSTKPTSGNKLLLQDVNGGEDETRDEQEALEELGRPFVDSKRHADFSFKVLTELWAEVLISKTHPVEERWRDEMSGFSIFAQHLLDACGDGGTTLLERYLEDEQLVSPRPTWMGEFLGLRIGKSKLVTLMKKITKDSRKIGLELLDMLKIIQAANAEGEVFGDFNYEELAVYANSIDVVKEKSQGKDLVKLTTTATNSVVEICEAIFRAAAFMICSRTFEEPEDDLESNASLDSVQNSKLQGIERQLAATDSKVSVLSTAVEKLTDVIAALLLNKDSGKSALVSPSRKHASRIDFPAERPKSFPGIREEGKKSATHADFVHEKKAVNISSSEALKKLIGFNSKGSSFVNDIDEPLTFNDLYARGRPRNQKFERLVTRPNRYLDLMNSGDMIVPLLGLTVQPLNTRAVHSAVDKLGRTIANGRGQGTILTRDVMHIQASDKQLTQTNWQSIASSTQGLPASYPHMVRLLTEQVAAVKEVLNSQGEFEDDGMMPLIEQNIALFIANMGEAAAKLLDGIKEPCMSPDGHWRGLMILFWHQYSRSFSSRKDDFHSVFFPEMLNDNFEDNREKLFNDYKFRAAQLTCDIGNAIKMTCWGCGVSDVSFQSCISVECKKKRAEEEHLHVYVAKTLGASGAKTYVGKLYKS